MEPWERRVLTDAGVSPALSLPDGQTDGNDERGCDPRSRNALRIRALRLCCLTSHYADLWSEVCNRELPPPTAPDHPGCATMPGNAVVASDAHSGRNPARNAGDTVATNELPGNVVAASDQRTDAPESMTAIEAFRTDAWTRQDPLAGRLRRPHPEGWECALGWEDVRDLPEGAVVTRRITDDTLPHGPTTREIAYHTPSDRCNREQDYMVDWNELYYRAESPLSRFHSTQTNLRYNAVWRK